MLAPGEQQRETDDRVSARRVLNGAVMSDLASCTALALLTILSAAGCALPGERAIGGCPVGEVCSNQTPNGLLFQGAAPGDGFAIGVATPAKGGTQTINVLLDDTKQTLPFDQPFDAATSDATVATISFIKPPTVSVRGAGGRHLTANP